MNDRLWTKHRTPAAPTSLYIIETGMDLWFVVESRENPRMVRLHHPSWKDVLTCIETFDKLATIGPTEIIGKVVGSYGYDIAIRNNVMAWYPRQGLPTGWVHTFIGTNYNHDVVAWEDRHGTVGLYRTYEPLVGMITNQPTPGAFFADLQAVSCFGQTMLPLSMESRVADDIVAEVDTNTPHGPGVFLYPDAWGTTMWLWVTGHSYFE